MRKLAKQKDVMFFYSDHAIAEMQNDGLARIDIENMLRRCRVTYVEDKKGDETWRAEGTDCDGRPIVAIVVAYTNIIKIKIITAWAKKNA